MKEFHEDPYADLLDERVEHWREVNLLDGAVARVNDLEEVGLISHCQRRHRLFRDFSTRICQMDDDRTGKIHRNVVFDAIFPIHFSYARANDPM